MGGTLHLPSTRFQHFGNEAPVYKGRSTVMHYCTRRHVLGLLPFSTIPNRQADFHSRPTCSNSETRESARKVQEEHITMTTHWVSVTSKGVKFRMCMRKRIKEKCSMEGEQRRTWEQTELVDLEE